MENIKEELTKKSKALETIEGEVRLVDLSYVLRNESIRSLLFSYDFLASLCFPPSLSLSCHYHPSTLTVNVRGIVIEQTLKKDLVLGTHSSLTSSDINLKATEETKLSIT